MGRQPGVTRTDIDRALKAAADAGLHISELLIEPRKVRVIIASPDLASTAGKGKTVGPKEWPSGD